MKKWLPLFLFFWVSVVSTAEAATLRDGVDHLRANKYEAAYLVFLKQAQRGNPEAMYHLGRSLIRGQGVKKGPVLALLWFEKAFSLQSEIKGKIAYEVGRIYQADRQLRNYEKAYKWFWKSLENGYGKGHVQLAELYERGQGTSKNKKQCLYHIERAAKLNYPQSMLAYALHLKAGDYGPADKREIKRWVEKAIKRLERQARRGSGAASVRLGRLYLSDELVPKDMRLAKKWLKWGRKNGSNLAKRYLKKIEP